MNMAGRRLSFGSFCVISLYKKAEYTIKLSMKPVPWSMKPPMMTGNACSGISFFEMFAAWGPQINSGYAGKIQTGVILAMVNV